MARQAAHHPATRTSTRTTTLALVGLSMSVLLASLGTSISNVALPTFVETFGSTIQQVQWIVLAYLLAVTTLVVSVGRLGDLIGRRRLLIAGLVIFTLASVLCGVAPNLWALIGARAIQGLGAAIMMALGMALVGETVPAERIGSAMGLLGTVSAVGTALGPTLGGTLIGSLGWPFIYLINAPFGLLAITLLYRALPKDVPSKGQTRNAFDFVGTFLLAAMLAAYSLSMTGGRTGFASSSLGLFVVAAALSCAFVWVEAKTSSPLIDPAVFRTRGLSAGFLMSALVTTVVMATLVVGPFYLSQALELAPLSVGLVMSSGPTVAALTGIPAGRVVDRYGADRVLISGLVTAAAGCVAMASVPASFGVAGYVPSLAVITAGYAIFQAANNTAVMTGILPEQRGVISGMLNLSRNLGLISGASAMGAVFAFGESIVGDATPLAASATNGMRLTFWVAAVLISASVLLALRARHKSNEILL
jgi:EmrB/QacA subfamily drug resistance transporter